MATSRSRPSPPRALDVAGAQPRGKAGRSSNARKRRRRPQAENTKADLKSDVETRRQPEAPAEQLAALTEATAGFDGVAVVGLRETKAEPAAGELDAEQTAETGEHWGRGRGGARRSRLRC